MLILNFKDNCKVNIHYGHEAWYQNDLLHRLDGPAVEDADGTKYWYQNDNLHRLDGPAIDRADGDKEWWHNGEPSPIRWSSN